MTGISNALVVSNRGTDDKRTAERRPLNLPARLTWKDERGTMRFATGIARNASEFGVYVECTTPVRIPLYRLVQVQVEREAGSASGLPSSLTRGRMLSAVYRITPASMSQRQGLALRLMVDPRTVVAQAPARATA